MPSENAFGGSGVPENAAKQAEPANAATAFAARRCGPTPNG
jgi:hypothetical protein